MASLAFANPAQPQPSHLASRHCQRNNPTPTPINQPEKPKKATTTPKLSTIDRQPSTTPWRDLRTTPWTDDHQPNYAPSR